MIKNNNALETIKHSTSQFEYSPSISPSKIHNKLPECIKKISLMKFKSKLRSYLISKFYYSLNEFYNENLFL